MSSHLTPPPQGFADPVARSQIAGILEGGLPVGTATALAAGATMADAVTGVAPASQALATTLAALGIRRRAITSTGSLAATDLGAEVDATSGTFALTAASSLGASFWCIVRNSGSGAVTFTPSGGAATVDGAGTLVIRAGDEYLLYLDTVSAGAWKTAQAAARVLGAGATVTDYLAFDVPKTVSLYQSAAGTLRVGTGAASGYGILELYKLVATGEMQVAGDVSFTNFYPTYLSAVVAGVVLASNDNATRSGWLAQYGPVSKAANQTVANATLVSDTHLVATLKASRTYRFRFTLAVTTGAVLEGIKVTLAGTATATNIVAEVEIKDHAATPVFVTGRISAMAGTAVGLTVAAAGNASVEISGSIECSGAGTFLVQWAKNASTGATLTTVLRDSTLDIEDVT